MEAKTGVEAQGQGGCIGRPSDIRTACARSLGDVERVLLIALVILGEALFEPVNPTRIEGKELEIVGFQIRIGGELQEEGKPVVAGGFS